MKLFNCLKIVIYFITLFLLFINIILANHMMIFVSLLAMLFYFLIAFFEFLFKLNMSSLVKFILCLFVFGGLVLGEICKFYSFISFYDNVLHFMGGFIAASIGYSIVYSLIKNKKIILIPIIFVICFSVTIGVFWELFEYKADKILNEDMQKDTLVNNFKSSFFDKNDMLETINVTNILRTRIYTIDKTITIENGYLDIGLTDTIDDLCLDFLGSVFMSLLIYFNYKNFKRFSFVNYLVIKK